MSQIHPLPAAIWYNPVKDYTSADSRPAEGRTIIAANRVPPPGGGMCGAHGILIQNPCSLAPTGEADGLGPIGWDWGKGAWP